MVEDHGECRQNREFEKLGFRECLLFKNNKIPHVVTVLAVEKNENTRVSTRLIFLPHV